MAGIAKDRHGVADKCLLIDSDDDVHRPQLLSGIVDILVRRTIGLRACFKGYQSLLLHQGANFLRVQGLEAKCAEEDGERTHMILRPHLGPESAPVRQHAFAPANVDHPTVILEDAHRLPGPIRHRELGLQHGCHMLGPPSRVPRSYATLNQCGGPRMMSGRPMVDAVVVGGGPAGLTAAIALAGAGVPTALVAGRPRPTDNRTTMLLMGSVTALT